MKRRSYIQSGYENQSHFSAYYQEMSLFYNKFEDQKKLYLIKWQHRIQYFVQLSLFLTIVSE
jgi:hypothetical protein